MKILMLQTERGSPDGHTVLTYVEGQEYDLSRTPREHELAEAFLRMGVATSNEKQPEPPAGYTVLAYVEGQEYDLSRTPREHEKQPEPPAAPVAEPAQLPEPEQGKAKRGRR